MDLWNCIQESLVHGLDARFGELQEALTLLRQPYGVGARVVFCAPTLKQAFFQHARNDVGQGRSIDPRALHEVGLAQAFRTGDRALL